MNSQNLDRIEPDGIRICVQFFSTHIALLMRLALRVRLLKSRLPFVRRWGVRVTMPVGCILTAVPPTLSVRPRELHGRGDQVVRTCDLDRSHIHEHASDHGHECH